MANVLHSRLERLACDFDLQDNYFAWQAFGRRYASGGTGPLPPYLQRENFETVRKRAKNIEVVHASFTEYLAARGPKSVDAYVLLDAQDWMTDEQLTALWTEISKSARPGARVIFRTAGIETILPGRIPDDILARFSYDPEESKTMTARDRSSIYGGFHVYTLVR
jgi:S-adenosylmethionine-diacylglycerol 3-amino-3-carboxypropyl transferase